MNEYHEQAEAFLTKHNIKVTVRNGGLRTSKHWSPDEPEHHTAIFTFSRKGKPSIRFTLYMSLSETYVYEANPSRMGNAIRTDTVKEWKAPHAYDILACLDKSEPEPFDTWVRDFGYDERPRGVGFIEHYKQTRATYAAVKRDWKKVSAFFTPEEIEELQEIN